MKNEDRTVLNQIFLSLSFCSLSFSVPIAMRDRTASTPIRIIPSPLLAIVVWSATSIARHIVLLESIIANVTTSSCELTTVRLRIHQRFELIVISDAALPTDARFSQRIGRVHRFSYHSQDQEAKDE